MIFELSLGVCSTELHSLVSSLENLVSNGRQVLLGGIRLGSSTTSRTTCESLVHKLGRKGPRITKELLDITTSHASGEEAVGAIFYGPKGKAKRDKDTGEGASNRPKKNNKLQREGSLMATINRKGVQSPPRVPRTTSRSYSKGHA